MHGRWRQTLLLEDISSPAVSLLYIKIHINSAILDADRGAKYPSCDMENFYLNDHMSIYRYIRISLKDLPKEIIQEYDLRKIAHTKYVYTEISNGMYSLK